MNRGKKKPAVHIQAWLDVQTQATALAAYQRALDQGLTPREILNQALTLYGEQYDIFPAPRPKSSDVNLKSHDVLSRAEAVLAEIQLALQHGLSRAPIQETRFEGQIDVLSDSAVKMIATAREALPE